MPGVKQDHEVTRQVVWDMVDWIEADLSRKMNTSLVAEKAGYTRWHFQRLFKLMTGHTLGHYIRGRRMTVAAILLKTTDLSITDIYLRVGLDNGATFSRIFLRYFGLPPTAYRDSDDDFSSRMLPPLRQ